MKTPTHTARRAAYSLASLSTPKIRTTGRTHVRWFASTHSLSDNASNNTSQSEVKAYQDSSIAEMLAEPSWSVSSLLPPKDQADAPPPITSKQLHHLLRLSALPPPASAEEEKSMMDTLAAQLHFVKEMQKVDTTGIEPLRAIRDETLEVQQEQEITLDTLKDALAQEEVVGKFYKRIRRRAETTKPRRQPEDWDPLSHATRTAGKYFVVDSGKGNSD